jgi:hypothetical protein
MPGIGNASALEIGFSLIAFSGLLFALSNAITRYQDLIWSYKEKDDGGRRLNARSHFREEVFAIAKLTLALAAGIFAMTMPEPKTTQGQVSTAVFSFCILGIVLFVWAGSIFRFGERRLLVADLEASRKRNHKGPRP